MNWHILVWGKSKAGAQQAQEGDIIDVLPECQWADNNMETKLCIIVPAKNLTTEQARALCEPGILMKRKYKIELSDIGKITFINESDIKDDTKSYQPVLNSNIITDVTKANIVKDKTGDVVNIGNINLRI